MSEEIEKSLGIPKGYRPGMDRSPEGYYKVSHLYEIGEHDMDFLNPMCARGWNRDDGESYSIWRGLVSDFGVCKICMKRAKAKLPGVECKQV